MGIDMRHICDACRATLNDGDDAYCESCYADRSKTIDQLQDEISDLEDKVSRLEADLELERKQH